MVKVEEKDMVIYVNDYEIKIKAMKLEKFNWWNAYITDDRFIGKDYENKGNCTYHQYNQIGFDSAHFRNETMTSEEKLVDVINQSVGFLLDLK